MTPDLPPNLPPGYRCYTNRLRAGLRKLYPEGCPDEVYWIKENRQSHIHLQDAWNHRRHRRVARKAINQNPNIEI